MFCGGCLLESERVHFVCFLPVRTGVFAESMSGILLDRCDNLYGSPLFHEKSGLRQAILCVHQGLITVLDRCPTRLQYTNCDQFRWLVNSDTGLRMCVEIARWIKMSYRSTGGFICRLAPEPELLARPPDSGICSPHSPTPEYRNTHLAR